MSLIEKIDERILQYKKLEENHLKNGADKLAYICQGRRYEAQAIKELLLSEQKERIVEVNKTIGDKIRESNESMAEWAIKYRDDTCTYGCNGTCEEHKNCADGLHDYLNQPYTE
jgi:hypothetical protein